MTKQEQLFDDVYNLAQNIHDAYQMSPNIWEDLETALTAVWDAARSEGYAECSEDRDEADYWDEVRNG